MKIYLAQSMLGYGGSQSDFVAKLRSALTSEGHTIYDPYEFETDGLTDAELVALDFSYVDKADLLIAYLQRPSNGGGTYAELFRAAFGGKAVIFVAPQKMYGPWMRHFTVAHVDTDAFSDVDAQVRATIDAAKAHFCPAPEKKIVSVELFRL
jgi:hypothetical protein